MRFAIDPGGIRLMNAIARAGGPKYPAYEIKITIKRDGRTYEEARSTVVDRPGEDISLTPGDVVYLARVPRIFMVFGSTLPPGSVGGINNRRFSFENDEMSLAEALAKAGGLDPTRANAKSFFVYRFEPKPLLESVGIDVSQFPTKAAPAVYKFDLSKPDGIFLAHTFKMHDHELLAAAESPSTELITLMHPFTTSSSNAFNLTAPFFNF